MAEAKFTCRFQVAGKVLEVGEVQAFASGFTKRTLVIEASRDAEKFSNPIELTLKKDDCAKADTIGVGDFVEAEGFVEGRKWVKPTGEVRHYIDLSAKSVIVTERAPRPTTASNWEELLAVGAAYGEGEEAVKARGKAFGKASKDMQAADWQALADAIIAAHAAPDAAEEWDGDPDDMPF